MTTTGPKTIGRPKKSGDDLIAIERSRVYAFLEARLPQYRVRGRLSVYDLAKAIGYSHQGIYHWFSKDRLTPAAAAELVKVSDGAFTMADMIPFFVATSK